jgi:hypothetical protein
VSRKLLVIRKGTKVLYGLLVVKQMTGRPARWPWSKMMEWGEDFGRELAIAIKDYIRPLRDRIAELETQVKFLKESGVNFRGPFQDGETYAAGDAVQRSGSVWRAYATTTKQPPGEGWRLMVKKGRDARDRDGKDAA